MVKESLKDKSITKKYDDNLIRNQPANYSPTQKFMRDIVGGGTNGSMWGTGNNLPRMNGILRKDDGTTGSMFGINRNLKLNRGSTNERL